MLPVSDAVILGTVALTRVERGRPYLEAAPSGQRLGDVAWPAGAVPVTVLRAGRFRSAAPGIVLRAGDRVSVLAAAPRASGAAEDAVGGRPA
jgi:hypothetical protein